MSSVSEKSKLIDTVTCSASYKPENALVFLNLCSFILLP